MMKRLLLISLIFLIASCKEESKTCKLSGVLENAPKTTTLYLVDIENNVYIDSIVLINGKFDYEFELSNPKKILLHNERNEYEFRDKKYIWLEPTEISITGDFEFIKNLKIQGSKSHSEFDKYSFFTDNYTKKINKIKEQIHLKTDDEKKDDSIKIENLKTELSDSIFEFMLKHSDSFVILSLLHDECMIYDRHLNKEKVKKVYDAMPDELKQLNQGITIKKIINLPEPPKVGDIAPEITQVTPNGDTIRLSDFKGKLIILDFWASWCEPCRGSNKSLKKVYDKYKTKGFEIFSVSGDENKDNWINAIKSDSITWLQVSDLKGWHNEAFLRYGIKVIPKTFIISPEGVILDDKYFCNDVILDKIIFEYLNKNGL